MTRSPYPLQWPARLPRTQPRARRYSAFGRAQRGRSRAPLSPYEAAKEVLHELELLGAANMVITSLLPTRHDGLPYADGRSEDPGVAVWFVFDGRDRVFACDQWHTHADNLHAIALSVGAMRGLERWGMADVVNRVFAGFAALPPGASDAPSEPPRPAWRELFGVGDLAALPAEDLLAVVKGRYRKLIAEAHPDAGGTHDRAAELNAALAEAETELAP